MSEETDTEATAGDESTLEAAATAVKSAASSTVEAAGNVVEKVVDTVKDAVSSDDDDDAADTDRSARKVREGTVVSNKMDKTAVVAVVSRVPHAKYQKMILQTTKLYAHDETNDVNIGDRVRVMETRALSKKKRWRVTDVLERAK